MSKRFAKAVAQDILHLARRNGMPLTPMQVTKLAFIAYGWYLALRDGREKLFEDRIEAWRYGPVVPALYHEFKIYGRNEIPSVSIPDKLNYPNLEKFLETIVKKYGKYSGFSLSGLTHREGSPWHQVYDENALSSEIPDAIIFKHYSAARNRNQEKKKKRAKSRTGER